MVEAIGQAWLFASGLCYLRTPMGFTGALLFEFHSHDLDRHAPGIRRVVTGLIALDFGVVMAMNLSPPTPALLSKVGFFMLVVSAIGLILGSL